MESHSHSHSHLHSHQVRTPSETQLLESQLAHELLTRFHFAVSPGWLTNFLRTVRQPPPPLPALTSTAHFRLLNSDLTQSLSHPASHGSSLLLSFSTTTTTTTSQQQQQQQSLFLLPYDIVDVNVKESRLHVNVPVQVLDVQDVGSSKWAQIEAIERVERGEEVKGREVIRTLPIMHDHEDGPVAGETRGNSGSGSGSGALVVANPKKSTGPHKVLLQDAAGTKVWGFEKGTVPKLYVTNAVEEGGLQIGAKVLLKQGLCVRRGLIMLEPTHVTVLGGKVEAWDSKWRSRRKQRLTDHLMMENEEHETGR